MNISSYDLVILQKGIECAMYPHLYPTSDFTDTGIMEQYKAATGDQTNRVVSTGQSWARKLLAVRGAALRGAAALGRRAPTKRRRQRAARGATVARGATHR